MDTKGLGITLFTGKNAANIMEFFKNHEDSHKRAAGYKRHKEVYCALDYIEDNAEEGGFLNEKALKDGLVDLFRNTGGTAEEIAMIIREETSVSGFKGFTECPFTEGMILYVQSFPWQLSNEERALTEKDIVQILEKYGTELGVSSEQIGEKGQAYRSPDSRTGEMDRSEIIDGIFKSIGKMLDGAEDYWWSDEWGIICRTREQAETIADLFDDMYQEGVCVTGTWDKEEDVKEGTIDEYTGRAYVNIF